VIGGRYQLQRELGRGGMGVVYQAQDLETGQQVAVKRVLAADPNPARRERFLREGRLAAELDHPGLVKVLATGEHQAQPYLVQALVPGANSLAAVLPHASLSRKLELIRDAARALGYAHTHGVVHRDVKPDNLLVDLAGQLRVSDFGLATCPGQDRLTQTGALVGTPTHMAPEQIRGERDAQGPPTDVWALGVILYEALTDQHPFAEGVDQLAHLMIQILGQTPPPPGQLVKNLPAGLSDVCLRALAREPGDRYADGEALAAALDGVLRRLGDADPVADPRGGGARGVALAVLLIGCALGVGIVAAGRPAPAPDEGSGSSASPTGPSPAPDVAEVRDSPRVVPQLGAWARAKALALEGRYEEALQDLNTVLEEDPRSLAALNERALALSRSGRPEQALADAELAIQIDPSGHVPLVRKGEALWKLERYEQALVVLDEAVRRNPAASFAMVLRASSYRQLGQRDRALEEYRRALALIPPTHPLHARVNESYRELLGEDTPPAASEAGDFETLTQRGIALEAAGDLGAARECFSQAIQLRPEVAEAWYKRGFVRDALEDWEGAIEDYTEAIRLRPNYAAAYIGRSASRASLGDFEGTIADNTEAIRLDPLDAVAYTNRGIALGNLGDWQGQLRDCNRAIQLDPGYASAYVNRGLALAALGDYRGAIEDWERAPPVDAQAYVNLALARSRVGDHQGALRDAQAAIRLDPSFARAFFVRAKARAALGDLEGAVEDNSEAIRLDPAMTPAYNNRGQARGGLGDLRGKIEDLTVAIRLQPREPRAYNNRASARSELGDWRGAIEDWEQALELRPGASWAPTVRRNLEIARRELAKQDAE
jgi:tetratricopeptide (TPR) repeat protein